MKLGKEKDRQKHDVFLARKSSLGNSSMEVGLFQSVIKYSALVTKLICPCPGDKSRAMNQLEIATSA